MIVESGRLNAKNHLLEEYVYEHSPGVARDGSLAIIVGIKGEAIMREQLSRKAVCLIFWHHWPYAGAAMILIRTLGKMKISPGPKDLAKDVQLEVLMRKSARM